MIYLSTEWHEPEHLSVTVDVSSHRVLPLVQHLTLPKVTDLQYRLLIMICGHRFSHLRSLKCWITSPEARTTEQVKSVSFLLYPRTKQLNV